MLEHTNFLAILLATLASMAIGAGWYSILSQHWMKAVGFTEKQKDTIQQGSGSSNLIIATLCNLVMAFMLSGIIYHTGGADPFTLCRGIICGLLIWLGFIVPTMLINHRFQQKPTMLTLIDSTHYLLTLSVQGAIIGWLGT